MPTTTLSRSPATQKKPFTTRIGITRASEGDLAIVCIRTKRLTSDEKRLKRQLHHNREYVGEVEDQCLCWRYRGAWHRITDFRWSLVNAWFYDGELHYAENCEARRPNGRVRRFARIVTLSAPDQVVDEQELPEPIAGFRIGKEGMLVVDRTREPAARVRRWGEDWQALPRPDDASKFSRWVAGAADEGFWVSMGPQLRRWSNGRWHKVTTRGTVGQAPFVSLSPHRGRLAAVQSGEIWAGDFDTLKPVDLSPDPSMVWYEEDTLVVADARQGLIRFAPETDGGEPMVALPKPRPSAKKPARVGHRGPDTIAKTADKLWVRRGATFEPVALSPMWKAVGDDQLRWQTHPEDTWLPSRGQKRSRAPEPKPEPTLSERLRAIAAGSADLASLTEAIVRGPDVVVSTTPIVKHTPLGVAARYVDSPAILARMVALGADINGVSSTGHPPLVGALERDRRKNIEWLLRKGAAPSLPGTVEANGHSIAITSPLAFAASRGRAKAIRKMLDYDSDLSGTYIGQTALCWAGLRKHRDIFALLRERGVPIRARHSGASSPLWMLLKDAPQLVDEFFDDLRHDFAGAGGTEALIDPLAGQSLGQDRQDEIDYLVRHGAGARSERTVLLCIDTNQLECLEVGLRSGTPVSEFAMWRAVTREPINPEVLRLLLKHGGDPEMEDAGALFYVAVANDVASASVLVAAGADVDRLHYDPQHPRADPQTAYDHALRVGAEEVTEVLAPTTA
ncbi:MAG: hypothetical protein AAGF12_16490 [Myxococcota bacterium]